MQDSPTQAIGLAHPTAYRANNVRTNSILSIDQLIEQPLPIFGHSVRAFAQLTQGGSVFERAGDIILKDPGLALHTLQQLHAGSSHSPRAEVSSMAQAAMLLGIERVEQLPRGCPELERSLTGRARIGFTRAACRAFHAAFQAWDWAHIVNDHAPEEILLATLLHDVAEMALWIAAPDKMHEMRKLIFKDHLHTDEAQYLALGESLEHFSRGIATRWQLPSLVHDALRPENAHNPRVRGVMLAIQLGRAAERGWHTEKMQRTLALIAEHLDKPEDEVTAHVHFNAVRAAREAPFFDTRSAAALLPLLPGGDEVLIADEFPDNETRPNAESSPVIVETIHVAQATPLQDDIELQLGATEICLMPQNAVFEDTVRTLKAGMGDMSINDIMRIVVHGMHDGIGLNRVVFSMLSRDRRSLTPRYIIGADNDPAFSRFQLRLDKPHLFSQLLNKPASLWVNDSNRAKYWPMVPAEVAKLINTNTFFATSVHLENKPIGLFYADRRSIACALNEHAYTQFRRLCQLAIKSLAASSENHK